jgi:hypothetical protein
MKQQLFSDTSEVTTQEIIRLAQFSHSFDFLEDEPDIYTIDDGEAIEFANSKKNFSHF